MTKKKRKKLSALILLLSITIGYALLSTTLKINGIANIKSNTWDIHFENVVPNTNSTVTAETPSITDNATKVSYAVNLELPGDFYEFTVDAVNDGSINGEITKIDHKVYASDGETPATLPSYIHTSIYYDGTTTEPQEGDLLVAGYTKTYRIRIEYDPETTTLPSSDTSFVIVDEIKYTQTKRRNRSVEDIIQEIEANPDSYRNPNQSVANRDIGLDENGNVINLDMWVEIGEEDTIEKCYFKENANEVELGREDVYTPATSAAQVVNGEVQTPIPAYIMFEGESKFLPVTKIGYVFGNIAENSNVAISKVPKIPNTVKRIGPGFIATQPIESVTIPKEIEFIDYKAFAYCTNLSTLTFEPGSKLKIIDSVAFCENNLSGDLVLPQSLERINEAAFADNHLTSVTFPSTTQYVDYYENGIHYTSFDEDVIINHNY